MMSYSQLCSLLGMKQEDPEPSPLHMNVVEIQTFLSSPSGKRTKRLVYLVAVNASEDWHEALLLSGILRLHS